MPQLGNREVIFVPSGFGSSALSKASSGDIILGTPMTWEHSADFGVSVPEGVTAVSSGGPTRSETWDAAQRLGVSRFVDVFGSSETGGIGWRDASESAYYLYSDISNSNDQLRRSSGKILELQDHFRWVTDRTFFLEGRKDDVVQVGGVNVSIGLVRSRILELDEVAEVAVRMGRDRLKAFVVPHRSRVEMGNIRDRIYRALADLPATSRPATVTLGTSLPRNSMGKLSDWDND
jgi:4-coumarate--CoA ligase